MNVSTDQPSAAADLLPLSPVMLAACFDLCSAGDAITHQDPKSLGGTLLFLEEAFFSWQQSMQRDHSGKGCGTFPKGGE